MYVNVAYCIAIELSRLSFNYAKCVLFFSYEFSLSDLINVYWQILLMVLNYQRLENLASPLRIPQTVTNSF